MIYNSGKKQLFTSFCLAAVLFNACVELLCHSECKKSIRVYLDVVKFHSGKADNTTVVSIINLSFTLIKMVFQRSRSADSAHLCLFDLRYIQS